MFVYLRYTHPDFAYHDICGPFDTGEEAQKHAEEALNDKDFPDSDVKWELGGNFGTYGNGPVGHDGCIYIHELSK